MKAKLQFLLSVLLLWVGSTTAAWADWSGTYEDTSSGITYKLYLGDGSINQEKYAWVKYIDTTASDFTIPGTVTYNGVTYNVVGFIADKVDYFRCNCPNLRILRIPDSHLPSASIAFERYIGLVAGYFDGMPLLKEIWFNADAWALDRSIGGVFSFASTFTVYLSSGASGWLGSDFVEHVYLIPDFTTEGIGYQIFNGHARVVKFDTGSLANIVIPATISHNGTTYPVEYFGGADFWFSTAATSWIKTITFEGDIHFDGADLQELKSLEKVVFNGNANFYGSINNIRGPQLQQVEFHGEVSSLQSTLYGPTLRYVYFFDELPEINNNSFNKSIITVYANMTAAEIQEFKHGSGSYYWGDIDMQPINAAPVGDIIAGSVSDWLDHLQPTQTLDCDRICVVGYQGTYDLAAMKELCDGTRASIKALDLSEATFPSSLQLSFAGFSTLDTLYLPNAAITLADNCFQGCKSTLVVVANRATPYATAGENSFGSGGADVAAMTLIAPSGALYTYRNSEPWNQFGTIQLTEWAGNATISLWAGACNAPVELWAGGEKVCTVAKGGGVATQTIQMPKTVELRIPVAFLDKILINSNDVTALLPSTEPTGEAYSGYRFYTVEEISAFTAIEVKMNGNAYMTQSMMFTISGGPGTANVTIDYADGTSETFDMEHDGESGTYHPLNFYSTAQNGRMYATTMGIKKIVVIAHPNTDEFELTLFDAGKINQTQAENGEVMNYTAENDGSGTYTYTLLGENMTSSYVHLTFPGTMQNDVKTTIAVNGNYQVKYFFSNFDMGMEGSGYYNVKLSDDYISGTTTVSHDGSPDSYGSILIFTENAGLNPNFRVIMNGEVIQCGNSSYEYSLTWGGGWTTGYDSYMNYELGDGYNKLPYYILTLEDANIASDSWIIIDDGSTPLNQIVSPLQVAQTARVIGGGTLSLRNSEGTEVASVSEGEPSTLNWPKGDDLTLAVTLPDGADIANYDAFLFIDGTCNTLQKVDGTAFAPYSMGSINTAHTIILVIKQTGGFETPDIIEFASNIVKAVCVEKWDTDGDGELSKAEAEAVTSLDGNTFTALREGMSGYNIEMHDFTFDEFQYFTNVTTLPNNLFQGVDSMVSIVLPPNLTTIGSEVFSRCNKLKSIVIPESVTSMGVNVLYYNGRLETVVLPSNLTSIPNHAFYRCQKLSNIVLPKTLTSIGDGAFQTCEALTNIDLPETLTTIGQSAFYLTGLRSVFIPKNVSSIGPDAFASCQNLVSIEVDGDNPTFAAPNHGNVIIDKDSKTAIAGACNARIPEGTTTIATEAFRTPLITSIELPASITQIQILAFRECDNLTSIVSKIPTPFQLNVLSFYLSSNCVLTVPKGTKNAYIQAGWTTEIFKGGIIEEEAPGIPGDINGDGQVTIADVTKLVNIILGKE